MIKGTNLGDINRITTILNINDKNLLRQECADELVDKVNYLAKEVESKYGHIKQIQQLKHDALVYDRNSLHCPITKVQADFRDVLAYLYMHKSNSKSNTKLSINKYIKALQ